MPGETETIPAPSVKGVPADPGSQEVPASPQGDPKPQEAEQPKVEGQDNKPQATEAPRQRPSDYAREREKVRRLQAALDAQNKRIEGLASQLKQSKPEATDVKNWTEEDWKNFLQNPENVFTAREKRLMDEIQKLQTRFDGLEQGKVQSEQARNALEGLEMLFPKSSENPDESLEDRMDVDPVRRDKIDKLMKTTVLGKLFDENPKEAAELILLKIGSEKPSASPTVLKKELMGGGARGGPSTVRTSPKDQKRAELRKLVDEADRNEPLRFDEKHKERRQQLIRELEMLEKE